MLKRKEQDLLNQYLYQKQKIQLEDQQNEVLIDTTQKLKEKTKIIDDAKNIITDTLKLIDNFGQTIEYVDADIKNSNKHQI